MEENWICPKCQSSNIDDKMVTVFPMCENCGNSFEWSEINHLSVQEISLAESNTLQTGDEPNIKEINTK